MSVSAYYEGSRAFSIMDQVEQLLSHTYGPRPDIDFACQVGVSAFCLRAFAMIDWNRSLCQRRETFFNFDFVPPHGTSTGYANDGSHDLVRKPPSPLRRPGASFSALTMQWFGLSSSMAILLARVYNLVAKVHKNPSIRGSYRTTLTVNSVRDALASYLPSFTLVDKGKPRHPATWAAELAVEQEIWRSLGLVLLDRHLRNVSPFDPTMRDNINLMLSLLRSLPTLSTPRRTSEGTMLDWWSSFYTTPAFIVGSLVTDATDRNFIRKYLKERGPEKALEDMLVILECTWAETDKTGIVADWYTEMTRLGLHLIFF